MVGLCSVSISVTFKYYFTAHQYLNVTDKDTEQRWIQINAPFLRYQPQYAQAIEEAKMSGDPVYLQNLINNPQVEPVMVEDVDPLTGKVMEDEDGLPMLVPMSLEETEFSFVNFEVTIEILPYENEQEANKFLMDTWFASPIGQMIMQMAPQEAFQMQAELFEGLGSRAAQKISETLRKASTNLQQPAQAQNQLISGDNFRSSQGQ